MGIVEKVRGKSLKGSFQELQAIGTGVKVAERTLTAAELKALYTTPLALVAAPGATKCLAVVEVFAKYVFTTTAFTGSNNLEFRYTSSNGAKATADINASFLLSASGTNYRSVKGIVTEQTPVVNAPIVIDVPSADPAQGLGTMKVTVVYRVVTP
jgi:hypothetical protein